MKKRGRLIIKRHGWLVAITLAVWCLIILMILFVDPLNVESVILPESYFLAGALVYTGLFLLLSIVTLSAKRAFLWATILIIVIYLRIWRLGNYFNLLLLLSMTICIEIYWRQKTREIK